MAYHQQPWSQRFKTLGDIAEGVFLQVAPLGPAERVGWRRPSLPMSAMSDFLRHAPDFYTKSGHLVEVMGCGRDGIVKLKESKYKALLEWAKHQKLALFVFNSKLNTWVLTPFESVKKAVARARRRGRVAAFENDGNVYFELPYQELQEDKDAMSGSAP